MDQKTATFIGPWGGSGGDHWDDGSYSGVREITLAYGSCIDSIRMVYDKNGEPLPSGWHGGYGGRTAEVKLQFPDEYLIGVSGHYGSFFWFGPVVVRSLKFTTNKRIYGPFGTQSGTPFSLSLDGGKIVGFAGRDGWWIDNIGFYVRQA